MDQTTLIIAVIVAVVVIVAVALWAYSQKRRSEDLRERFGPEYGRAVRASGDPRRAEAELAARQERVERLHIRPLSAPDRERFAQAWHATQARFVDDPAGAMADADRLVDEVMRARGYPMGDFEQRAADVSVDHAAVVEHYRLAHGIAQRAQRGEASTEDLRKAMVHYRALFEDLLGSEQTERMEVQR
ncbi:MAG TPA: hypothetical protein VK066_05400 [Chloroflexota bacterium]|nr:hypothetical protein [Chloroflexota bacterium]